ncbi:MAG: helix-turn-helix domain-containing protein [Candidatus Nanopelagicales bacterium]
MTMGAVVLREARERAGLSVRGLAASAGVAYSTVARIESGRLDPTTGMLARLLEAAGCRLELVAVRVPVPRQADLVDAWAVDPLGQDRPDWTRLRGFLDYLAEHPRQVGVALAAPPPQSGSGFMDALLAGIAEKACDYAGVPRPGWARRVPGLPMPWISPGTPRMQAAARAGTPPQLAARNIFIRADSLWRDAAAVGA